jgi:hypothetical protein
MLQGLLHLLPMQQGTGPSMLQQPQLPALLLAQQHQQGWQAMRRQLLLLGLLKGSPLHC